MRLCRRAPLFAALFLLFALSSASMSAAAQRRPTAVEGILHIVWGDPHPDHGRGGRPLHLLQLADGSRITLELSGQEALAAHYFRRRVLVSGTFTARQSAAVTAPDHPSVLVVDRLSALTEPDGHLRASGDTARTAPATRAALYLLLAFADDPTGPHPPAFYLRLNGSGEPSPDGDRLPATINGFFAKTSWGQLAWQADVGGVGGLGAPGGWLVLPYPKAHYAPCGWGGSCADIYAIADHGMALGRAHGIRFADFDQINFVLSNDLDCCAWGGGYYDVVDGRSYGATWSPPWAQDASVYVHELGHSLGLPHSGWAYHAYDSPWDSMSAMSRVQATACGAYTSRNSGDAVRALLCTAPGGGFIAAHKHHLGWVPPDNIVVTDTTASIEVSLEAMTLPLGAAPKMLLICIAGLPCTGPSAHYFTVEARVGGLGEWSDYDNGLPGDGVVIHEVQTDRSAVGGPCFFNQQSGWAWPVDATPDDWDFARCGPGHRDYPDYGLFNAQWRPGEVYTDPRFGFSVRIVSRQESTFVVSIRPDRVVTTTWLESSANPVAVGRSVAFTATVKPEAARPVSMTGLVTFHDGSSLLGTATLDAGGQATLTIALSAVGSRSITARYGGDGSFHDSVSATLIQTVVRLRGRRVRPAVLRLDRGSHLGRPHDRPFVRPAALLRGGR